MQARTLCTLVLVAAAASGAAAQVNSSARASPLTSSWLILLRLDVDAAAWAAKVCGADSALRQRLRYSCTAVFTSLVRGVAGEPLPGLL
jgi:hypothetical protein